MIIEKEIWNVLWKAFNEEKLDPYSYLKVTKPLLEDKINKHLLQMLWTIAYEKEMDIVHFLDSMGPSQIESKTWLVEKLSLVIPTFFELNEKIRVQLLGGWFGSPLSIMLKQNSDQIESIDNIDIDPKTKKFFENFMSIYNIAGNHYCQNILDPIMDDDKTHVVINTSSEHMPSLPKILENKNYRENTIFALQSNNMFHVNDHINCVENEDELLEKSGIKQKIYKGSLDMPNGYKRFMVIGKC